MTKTSSADDHRRVILYLSHSAHLYGAELCLLTLLANLDRTRFKPIVVVPQAGPLVEKLEELHIPVITISSITPWLTRRTGIMKFVYILAALPFILVTVWRLRRVIHQNKVDLVHTNSLVVIEGALAAKITRRPHLWHARELLIPETVFNFFLGPRAIVSIVNYLSAQIISMSQGVKDVFCRESVCSKVSVIYDGFEVPEPSTVPQTRSLHAELNIPDNVPLVGVIGRITKIKGIEDLVKAAVRVREVHPEARFVAIGGRANSDAAYEEHILELIREHHLESHFQLPGYRDDATAIVSELDLLVLPSYTEAFGRVLVEAMAAGKPVVGTRVGGIPEIIDEGLTGLLVPPGAPDALAQAIIQILQDVDLAHKMGAAGYHKVKTDFSIARQIAGVQQIYEEIMKERVVYRETHR